MHGCSALMATGSRLWTALPDRVCLSCNIQPWPCSRAHSCQINGPLKHVDSRTTQYPEGTVGSSQSVGSHGTVPKSFPECGIIKASLPSLSQYVDHTGQSPGTSESVTGPWHLGIPFLKLSTCYSMLGLGCGSYVPSLACRGDPSYVPRYCGAQ